VGRYFYEDFRDLLGCFGHIYRRELKRGVSARRLVYELMSTFLKNVKLDLTSTGVTTLYTTPAAKTAVFKSILVSEDSGSADTITVTITDASAAVFSLFKVKAVAANTTVELLSQPLVVETSEILKFTAATANRLHVVASYMELG
jgi:hypothetical protein|tara:strand:- start:29 stop:463 length:435 start_codon:yes stop_codon:yes gene_type:complete